MLRLAKTWHLSRAFGRTWHVFQGDTVNLDKVPASPLMAYLDFPVSGGVRNFRGLAILMDRVEVRPKIETTTRF